MIVCHNGCRTDILVLFQSLDGSILRSYVSWQEGALLGLMVKHMLTDYGDDMHCQFFEILRSLLDSSPGAQRENIVEIFYEKHLNQLVDVLSSCLSNSGGQTGSKSGSSFGGSGNQRSVKPEVLINICDLLCFCVLQHPYRIKCDFLLIDVIEKDEHLINHVVKKNLFKPIIDAFVANGDRYNLLNSAVLELFEYIRKENLKVLLRYLVDTFWDQLEKFETLSSIHALKVKYEQSLESVGMVSTGTLLDQRKRLDERALDREEEDYYNEDSDEEDSATTNRRKFQPPVLVNGLALENTSPRSGGLVDYDDDEDDENYRPPPKKTTGSSDEDEGLREFPLKRKFASKEDSEAKRLKLSSKSLKPSAVFCCTLKKGELPSKKPATGNILPPSVNQNTVATNPEKGGLVGASENAEEGKQNGEEEVFSKSCNDGLDDSADNRNLGDERTLLSPKSSLEMAVKGS
ncbi:hypothetical protein SASPL_105256 [Salvia splendens]|uniref:Serine/threonine-protein phosphatase 4 regulatory subunit 3-like central domain-containing protein n=1 Tax=Salvia splendens TaxID=180675 RepID=A0A8X8YJI7_SALSN|nr:hypothetical protein SASPL_105256 [Salvia splendens]